MMDLKTDNLDQILKIIHQIDDNSYETILIVKAEVWMFTKLSTWWNPYILEKTLLK